MTLYDVACLFQTQLIDNFYIINTATTTLYIRAFPKNFLHFTGLQRAKEFRNINDLDKFFYDSLNNCYQKDIKKYNFSSTQDRNIVDMKMNSFDKIKATIKNAVTLYYVYDNNGSPSKAGLKKELCKW